MPTIHHDDGSMILVPSPPPPQALAHARDLAARPRAELSHETVYGRPTEAVARADSERCRGAARLHLDTAEAYLLAGDPEAAAGYYQLAAYSAARAGSLLQYGELRPIAETLRLLPIHTCHRCAKELPPTTRQRLVSEADSDAGIPALWQYWCGQCWEETP